MKITAGIGSVDDYIDFVKAGADELFLGYVPIKYMEQNGAETPLNRREVMYYNVQFGSESELDILADMIKVYKVPVSITINSPFYDPQKYNCILQIIEFLADKGFDTFIIADPGLVLYIRKNIKKDINIHLSGEIGEANEYLFELLKGKDIKRVVFQRKTSIEDMKEIVNSNEECEYEAFALNEMCHFSGGLCNSFHCDEFAPTCRIPYVWGKMNGIQTVGEITEEDNGEYITGESGCALCALWKLYNAGITHLKVVSRGNYSENTIRDIKALKSTLEILDNSDSENEFIDKMKKEIFKNECSHNCYYL